MKLAIALQVVGLVLLAVAAFTVSVGLGLTVSGVAAIGSGTVLEREFRRAPREP